MKAVIRFLFAFVWSIFSSPYEAYRSGIQANDNATLWGIAIGKALVSILEWLMILAAIAYFIIIWSI